MTDAETQLAGYFAKVEPAMARLAFYTRAPAINPRTSVARSTFQPEPPPQQEYIEPGPFDLSGCHYQRMDLITFGKYATCLFKESDCQ